MSRWQPQNALAQAVHSAGFDYDPSQDIIYSRMDALQRQLGFAYGYDQGAVFMSAAIDCEPIFFDYGGKTWMIELWKGQYGLETGAEIGVYNRRGGDLSLAYRILDQVLGKREHDSNPQHNLFFDCAGDDDMLVMSYTLFRDGKKVFSRGPEKHWWLTGFKWGIYSTPAQLTMNITITFDHAEMQTAFVNALRDLGYQNLQVISNQVNFIFDQPKTYQPRLNNPLLTSVNLANQEIVATYGTFGFPNNDPNTIPLNAFETVSVGVLQYETFFEQMLDRAIKDIPEWLDVISNLRNFKVMDFSCTVEFDNQTHDVSLVRKNYAVDKSTWPPGQNCGEFVVFPPENIPPGSRGRLLLQDEFGNHGGEGWVSYDLTDKNGTKQLIRFSFGCPMGLYNNHIEMAPGTANICFYAQSSHGDWGDKNHAPSHGHPLLVRFIIT